MCFGGFGIYHIEKSEIYQRVWQRAGKVSTSHGRAGATARERQWRAAGEGE